MQRRETATSKPARRFMLNSLSRGLVPWGQTCPAGHAQARFVWGLEKRLEMSGHKQRSQRQGARQARTPAGPCRMQELFSQGIGEKGRAVKIRNFCHQFLLMCPAAADNEPQMFGLAAGSGQRAPGAKTVLCLPSPSSALPRSCPISAHVNSRLVRFCTGPEAETSPPEDNLPEDNPQGNLRDRLPGRRKPL